MLNCYSLPLCHWSQVDKMTMLVKRGEASREGERMGWGAVTVSGFLSLSRCETDTHRSLVADFT